jgi:hypothetical protein
VLCKLGSGTDTWQVRRPEQRASSCLKTSAEQPVLPWFSCTHLPNCILPYRASVIMTTWSFDGQLAFNVSHWQNSTTDAGRNKGLALVDTAPAADVGISDGMGFGSSVSQRYTTLKATSRRKSEIHDNSAITAMNYILQYRSLSVCFRLIRIRHVCDILRCNKLTVVRCFAICDQSNKRCNAFC